MPSRSLGTLTLDLVAQTGGYVAGLDKAERQSEKWRRKVKKDVADVGKAFAASGVAAAAGIAAITVSTIKSAKEIQNFATIANTSEKEFQRISFAADRYGISQEKVADILKDTSDKVGDFLQTGAGPLADFFENIAPRVGVTADQFRDLSGKDALGLYVDSLEKANVSQNEMTFFMEAIASDATLLLPLLANNGSELNRLADNAEKFGAVLSDLDIQRLAEVATKTADMKLAFKGLSNEVALGALPAIEDLTDLLSDEQTIESAKTLANAIATSFSVAVSAIRDTIGVVEFLGESLAAGIGGPALDDIVRLEDKVAGLKSTIAALEPLALARPGDRSIAEQLKQAQQELVKYGDALAAANQLATQSAIVPATPSPAAGGAGDTSGSGAVRSSPAATRFIEELKMQTALLGKSKVDIELYKLELGKASPEQLKLAESLLRTVEAFDKQTEARKAAADEVAQINSETLAIQQSLLSEEDAIEASFARRRDIILNNTQVTGEAQTALLAKLSEQRDNQLANTSAQRQAQAEMESINQRALAIADSLLSEEEQIEQSYQRRHEIILANTAITGQAQAELLAAMDEERQSQTEELEAKRQLTQLENQELLFSGLSGLAKTFAGEQSGVYKALFAVEKAAAVARAIVAIQAGIAQAANLQFPANIAAMATVAAQTAGIVSTIQGTSLEGVAHAGLDSVPTTGTYLLEEGERVVTERTSARLDKTLDQIQQGGDNQQAQPVSVNAVTVLDPNEVASVLGSPEMGPTFINQVKLNRSAVRSALGLGLA